MGEKAKGLVLPNGDIRILYRYLRDFNPGDEVDLDVSLAKKSEEPDLDEHDDGTMDPNPETYEREGLDGGP